MTNKCFIIMPISTPENRLSDYSDDKDHFKHVLEHLIIPSLDKADLEPIPPITKGSEVIHAEIIKNIETTDLVLCDMSILNPNVFFELGIRTALNKPVCLIIDDVTPKIPFDAFIINHHKYLSALNTWEMEKEIDSLTTHIKESLEKSDESNSLWKYFSLRSTAHPAEVENSVEGRLDFLTMQIEALRNKLSDDGEENSSKYFSLFEDIAIEADICGQKIEHSQIDENGNIRIFLLDSPSENFIKAIQYISNHERKQILFIIKSSGDVMDISPQKKALLKINTRKKNQVSLSKI